MTNFNIIFLISSLKTLKSKESFIFIFNNFNFRSFILIIKNNNKVFIIIIIIKNNKIVNININ